MEGKKLTITVAQKEYDELEALAKQRGDTVAQALQIGMGLYRVVAKAHQEGEKIFVAASDDQSEREVLLPQRTQ